MGLNDNVLYSFRRWEISSVVDKSVNHPKAMRMLNMNRALILLTAIIFIVPGCNEETKKAESTIANHENDLLQNQLTGKVKSVRTTTYDAIEVSGAITAGDFESQEYVLFNREGFYIERNSCNWDGSIDGWDTFGYDSAGNLIKVRGYNADSSLISERRYWYNIRGKLIEEQSGGKAEIFGDSVDKQTYEYNDKGWLTARCDYFGENMKEKRIYEYDPHGNDTVMTVFDAKGNFKKKRTRKYDKSGDNNEVAWYNSEGRLTLRAIYKRNRRGKVMEHVTYDSFGNLKSKNTYDYDEQGNLTRLNFHTPGFEQWDTEYTAQFEYDAKGNWILEVEFVDGEPSSYIEREIEYY
jgi:hypothetical protein